MNYQALIEQNIETVYQTGIATKILQHMDRIRNVSDVSQARRWVMELFQNSRDAAYEDQPVKIRIELKENILSFSHNGRPFRVKDILSIINQVSSKTSGENLIGQFGTGFMTTYQLSEEVEVQAVLKDGQLPYKPFSIRMDRRGTTKEEILAGIFDTMEELKKADQSDTVTDFSRDGYNTKFLYHLNNEESRKIAQIGMTDLQETILYVLLFSEKIASVELAEEVNGTFHNVVYERGDEEELEGGLKRLCVVKTSADKEQSRRESHFLISLAQEDITLAAGWSREEGMIKLSDQLPRLFVDFPLIGAEDFPFPVVINCRNFRTNEPRSGITLVDNLASKDALVNKEIMERAAALFGRFLHSLARLNMGRLDHVTKIPEWKPNRELSEEWVKEHLYGRLYGIVAKEPMIKTKEGNTAFENQQFYLVSGIDAEEIKGIRKLLSVLDGIQIPEGEEDWEEAFAGYEPPQEKSLKLETIVRHAQDFLAERLKEEKMEPIAWCQFLYETAMRNLELAVRIKAGEICIFPNQNPQDWGQRRLFAIRSIRRDTGIPEILKEVSNILDELDSQRGDEPLKIRDHLLHLDFKDGGLKELEDYEQSRLHNHIVSRTNRKYPVRNFSIYKKIYEEAWDRAWLLMISCVEDEELYRFAKEFYGEKLPQRQILENSQFSGMWRNSCYWILSQILHAVGEEENLERFCERKFPHWTRTQVYEWPNGIYGKALLYMGESDARLIFAFPNQKGKFLMACQLRRDETVGEELKEIAREFQDMDSQCDIYQYVLDRNICLDYRYGLLAFREDEAAMRIHWAVQQILSGKNLSDAKPEHQEACTRLLAWIQEHENAAEKYFPGYCTEEEQMRLLTPKAAMRMQKKARDCQRLLEELGAQTMEEVIGRLAEYKKTQKEGADYFSDALWDGMAWDEDLGAEFGNLTDDKKEEILRQIGVAGEKYALANIKRYFKDLGYETVQDGDAETWMEKQKEEGESFYRARIYYPDNSKYHQAGWDIQVSLTGEREREEYYLEVKTYTPQSVVRKRVLLSNEQMKAAVRNRERYVVLRVLYNQREKRGEQMLAFADPVKQIEKGVFANQKNGYVFVVEDNREDME